MILVYLLLMFASTVLTVRLARQRSRHAITAGGATLLAALAVPTGFSIGIYLAAVAAMLAIIAASKMRSVDDVA